MNDIIAYCRCAGGPCAEDEDGPGDLRCIRRAPPVTNTTPDLLATLKKAQKLAWEVGCETVDGTNTLLEDERGDLWREITAVIDSLRTTPATSVEPLTLEESVSVSAPCCGQYQRCHRPCTPRGRWEGGRDLDLYKARYQWVANELFACDYGDNERGNAVVGWRLYGWRDRSGESRIFGKSIDDAVDSQLQRNAQSTAEPICTCGSDCAPGPVHDFGCPSRRIS